MTTLGIDYNLERYDPIPEVVEDMRDTEDVDMVDASIVSHDILRTPNILEQMKFVSTSWLYEDYEKAILNDEFFSSVKDMFPSHAAKANREEEEQQGLLLLREKYFVAEGSATLMSKCSTDHAIAILNEAMIMAPNIKQYLLDFVSDAQPSAVNLLLA